MLVVMFSIVSISNLEGLFLDAVGLVVDSTDSQSFFIKHLRHVVKRENKHGELWVQIDEKIFFSRSTDELTSTIHYF